MRDVTVLVGGIVDVFQPLLQLPQAADPIRSDTFPHSPQLVPEVQVNAQNRRRRNGVAQQVADDLMVHAGPHHEPSVLRGVARAGNQPLAVRRLNQRVHEKL